MEEDDGLHVMPLSIRGVLRIWSLFCAARFLEMAFLRGISRKKIFNFGILLIFRAARFVARDGKRGRMRGMGRTVLHGTLMAGWIVDGWARSANNDGERGRGSFWMWLG
jgi:hypothetical protein